MDYVSARQSSGLTVCSVASASGQDGSVVIVRATRKLLHRLGPATLTAGEESTTLLGDWYATLLPWRPRQVALLVSEHTLLPVMMPLAPAATLLDRFPDHLGAVLRAHRALEPLIASEIEHMRQHRVGPTANRSIVGSMTEFAYLADAYRAEGDPNLVEVSLRLSTVPCGPLYSRHVSPDRELAAVFREAPNLSAPQPQALRRVAGVEEPDASVRGGT